MMRSYCQSQTAEVKGSTGIIQEAQVKAQVQLWDTDSIYIGIVFQSSLS